MARLSGHWIWSSRMIVSSVPPAGRYRITAKKGTGNSTYYKALLLNYPNDEDRAQFERVIARSSVKELLERIKQQNSQS